MYYLNLANSLCEAMGGGKERVVVREVGSCPVSLASYS